MNEELKPCPFCGSEAEIYIKQLSPKYVPSIFISCKNSDCYARPSVMLYGDKQQAIEMWNRRATENE